jgi:hypothetical protein
MERHCCDATPRIHASTGPPFLRNRNVLKQMSCKRFHLYKCARERRLNRLDAHAQQLQQARGTICTRTTSISQIAISLEMRSSSARFEFTEPGFDRRVRSHFPVRFEQ